MPTMPTTLRVRYLDWWRRPLGWWANACTIAFPAELACRLAGHVLIEDRPFVGDYEGPYCQRCDRHVPDREVLPPKPASRP